MNPSAIFDVIVSLKTIEATSKDLHYAAKGLTFHAMHKLADEIGDGLSDHVDELIEKGYLGCSLEAPTSQSIYEAVVSKLKKDHLDEVALCHRLVFLIGNALIQLDQLADSSAAALNSLAGSIAEDLQQRGGFLDRVVKGL